MSKYIEETEVSINDPHAKIILAMQKDHIASMHKHIPTDTSMQEGSSMMLSLYSTFVANHFMSLMTATSLSVEEIEEIFYTAVKMRIKRMQENEIKHAH